MNKLSLLAMFKNEASIIEEWIEHYIREGVDHFYLIDNGSYDNYESKINKYKSKITLVKDPTRFEKKTQKILYNQHYLEKVKKETEWLIVCDIDEYFYLNDEMRLIDFLSEPPFPDAYWVPWRLFGTTKAFKDSPLRVWLNPIIQISLISGNNALLPQPQLAIPYTLRH